MDKRAKTPSGRSTPHTPICHKCGARMRWDAYLGSPRPDDLRGRDQRAPLAWAWHCRCGMWIYGLPHDGA